MSAAPKFVVRLLADARTAESQLTKVRTDMGAMARRRDELAAELANLDSTIRAAMATEAQLRETAELGAEAVLGLCSAHGWEVPSLPEPPELLPGEQPIEHRVRASSVSSQSLPIVQPVPAVPSASRVARFAAPVEGPNGTRCFNCHGELVQEDGTWLHTISQQEECNQAGPEYAARSEQDGSADL